MYQNHCFTWQFSKIDKVWYMKAPLSKNEVGKFLSTAAKNAGLSARRKKSNQLFHQENLYLKADLENFVASCVATKAWRVCNITSQLVGNTKAECP